VTPRKFAKKTSKIGHLGCKFGVVLEVQESPPSFWGSADMFVFEKMKLHTTLGGRRCLIERGFVCNQKKESKTEREEKRKCQGVEWKKKSLLNAGESGEALVKLEYSRIQQNIEINGENGCLMSKK